MWMTWPPATSIRSAELITSITMNGGTLLRVDAASRSATRSLMVASCIDICYFRPPDAQDWPHSRACKGISRISPAANRQRPPMLLDLHLQRKTSGLTVVTLAVAIALGPFASTRAEERQKGPPILRDTETE